VCKKVAAYQYAVELGLSQQLASCCSHSSIIGTAVNLSTMLGGHKCSTEAVQLVDINSMHLPSAAAKPVDAPYTAMNPGSKLPHFDTTSLKLLCIHRHYIFAMIYRVACN